MRLSKKKIERHVQVDDVWLIKMSDGTIFVGDVVIVVDHRDGSCTNHACTCDVMVNGRLTIAVVSPVCDVRIFP